MGDELYDFGGIFVCRPKDILWVDLDNYEFGTAGVWPWRQEVRVGPAAYVVMRNGHSREFFGAESVEKLRQAFAKYSAEVAAKLNAAEATNA